MSQIEHEQNLTLEPPHYHTACLYLANSTFMTSMLLHPPHKQRIYAQIVPITFPKSPAPLFSMVHSLYSYLWATLFSMKTETHKCNIQDNTSHKGLYTKSTVKLRKQLLIVLTSVRYKQEGVTQKKKKRHKESLRALPTW